MARPTLNTHPKFAMLAHRLQGRALARGVLELVWEAAYASGDAEIGPADAVEAIADWRGARGELAAALVECGFLDMQTHANGELLQAATYLVHDLEDHAPAYVLKRQAKEEERKAKGKDLRTIRQEAANARWDKARDAKDVQLHANGSTLHVVCTEIDANETPPAPAPAPARIRSRSDQIQIGAESSATAGTPPAKPAVLVFECAGKVRSWDLTADQIAGWVPLYPGLQVEVECRKALAWLQVNPKKTAGGMPKFLVGWLNRTNDRPAARGSPPRDIRVGHGRAEDVAHLHTKTGEIKL